MTFAQAQAVRSQAAARFNPAFASGEFVGEARAHHRARANWSVRLIGAGEAIVSGRVSDVSEGGMGLISNASVPVGTLLETALAVPHPTDPRRSLAVRAKVRVVNSSFCGTQSRLNVQFVTLSMEARLAIRNYAVPHR